MLVQDMMAEGLVVLRGFGVLVLEPMYILDGSICPCLSKAWPLRRPSHSGSDNTPGVSSTVFR